MHPSRPPRPSSPCNHNCGLQPDGLCGGCFRTYEEIVTWSKLTEIQRLAVMATLPARDPKFGTANGVAMRTPTEA